MLINCPECKNKISSSAVSCPNCGFSIFNYNEQRRAEQEMKSLASNIPMPPHPVFNTYVALDLFVSGILIYVFIGLDLYDSFAKLGISLVIFFILQACFFVICRKLSVDYRFAKTNFSAYQMMELKRDMERVKNKSYTGVYILSFLFPIIGFIMASIYLTKNNERNVGTNCIVVSIISILLSGIMSVILTG